MGRLGDTWRGLERRGEDWRDVGKMGDTWIGLERRR